MPKQLKTPPVNSVHRKLDSATQPTELRQESLSGKINKMIGHPTEKRLSTNGLMDSRHEAPPVERDNKILFSADKAVDGKVQESSNGL